ncbi:hypothetical protein CHH28_09155 [Bacterioplanes sanyensis]|uniref:AAA+ ATPase domain-containing protein n=1 Tax=Bacterioplanes sanyensis TaxID=1249553 RepID=A0A222FIF7_9GAMM|nr:CpaF family protein [Bacterioplanes sanyensis]ASP38837.1 hypothetical protein CHH28_09155 [Bacterioplanes sanyensis]
MFGRRDSAVGTDKVATAETPVPAATTNMANATNMASTGTAAQNSGKQRPAMLSDALRQVRETLLQRLDASAALQLSRTALRSMLLTETTALASELKLPLSGQDQQRLTDILLDDMLGFGPLQPLLDDDDISDVLVNGCQQVYVERHGQLRLTEVQFFDETHVRQVARRIAAAVGRRIDDSQPMVDARLADGSRVNIVIPPLALDGTTISIRKFNPHGFDLARLVSLGAMTADMAEVLRIATRSRANILISGGTGAGKTSLLNALSLNIDDGERIVTIEDAAELALQQPHVVRLETRPASAEGTSGIGQQELLVNALRMRPDRIVLGEVRSVEAFDMMQAMNTGHDGSMSTLHANSPSDALTRLENLLLMSQSNIPLSAIRRQMSSALDLIVQVNRGRDGRRRVTCISEVCGIEADRIQLQELFSYQLLDDSDQGRFVAHAIRPQLLQRAQAWGLSQALLSCTSGAMT